MGKPSSRQILSLFMPRQARQPAPRSGIWGATPGRTANLWRPGQQKTQLAPLCPYMRCILAPGGRRKTRSSPIIAGWRTNWPPTAKIWAIPMLSCCRSPNTPLKAPGDIRSPDTSRPPAGTELLRISCILWTGSTKTASASFWTGCPHIFPRTSTASPVLTAPRFLNAPTG